MILNVWILNTCKLTHVGTYDVHEYRNLSMHSVCVCVGVCALYLISQFVNSNSSSHFVHGSRYTVQGWHVFSTYAPCLIISYIFKVNLKQCFFQDFIVLHLLKIIFLHLIAIIFSFELHNIDESCYTRLLFSFSKPESSLWDDIAVSSCHILWTCIELTKFSLSVAFCSQYQGTGKGACVMQAFQYHEYFWNWTLHTAHCIVARTLSVNWMNTYLDTSFIIYNGNRWCWARIFPVEHVPSSEWMYESRISVCNHLQFAKSSHFLPENCSFWVNLDSWKLSDAYQFNVTVAILHLLPSIDLNPIAHCLLLLLIGNRHGTLYRIVHSISEQNPMPLRIEIVDGNDVKRWSKPVVCDGRESPYKKNGWKIHEMEKKQYLKSWKHKPCPQPENLTSHTTGPNQWNGRLIQITWKCIFLTYYY